MPPNSIRHPASVNKPNVRDYYGSASYDEAHRIKGNACDEDGEIDRDASIPSAEERKRQMEQLGSSLYREQVVSKPVAPAPEPAVNVKEANAEAFLQILPQQVGDMFIEEVSVEIAALIEERKAMVKRFCQRGDEMYDPWIVDAEVTASDVVCVDAVKEGDDGERKSNSDNASSTQSFSVDSGRPFSPSSSTSSSSISSTSSGLNCRRYEKSDHRANSIVSSVSSVVGELEGDAFRIMLQQYATSAVSVASSGKEQKMVHEAPVENDVEVSGTSEKSSDNNNQKGNDDSKNDAKDEDVVTGDI